MSLALTIETNGAGPTVEIKDQHVEVSLNRACRYAMVRWVECCRIARMAQLDSARNCGDIMTKCLVGPLFFAHRARVLGMELPADASEFRSVPGSPRARTHTKAAGVIAPVTAGAAAASVVGRK